MQNFHFIGNVKIASLKAALARHPELWNENNFRTTFEGSAHKEASDIWLRFNDLNSQTPLIDNLININYSAFKTLHQAKTLIFDLMHFVEGVELGRVIITKLPKGSKIYAHRDEGKSAEYYDRYHIVLQNYDGCIFRCGEEKICPKEGDIFLFNNQIEHEIINNSIDDKISLIIDIKS